MSLPDVALLSGLIFLAAVIYSSVGHAGASGYIAAMALFGLSPTVMKPTALALNILVAILATYRWHSAGLVRWKALPPLLITSIPMAFLGGAIHLPFSWYKAVVGVILLLAAAKFFVQPRETAAAPAQAGVPWAGGAAAGAGVGFLSGLTGTGGGIFLSPILLLCGWAGLRQAAGITAPFILANSVAGLAGSIMSLNSLPKELPVFLAAALLGALAGTQLGIGWIPAKQLQRVLALVLAIAGVKFLLT